MKFKVLYILAIVGLMSFTSNAQRVNGARIGYIDTEYILQNVPDYQEATSQLETKLTKWKSEIENKLADIETKKKALENEKVLLTKELYEERLEDISFEESEVLDYQQKRFGPDGDMVLQRTQLIQPVQDQIFAAVKEIAENKKYDFVFDKNADFLMLYSAERFDISEQVLRIITRASTREQAKTKRERKELEKEEAVPEVNNTKDERAKALEDRKAQRTADLEQKRIDREKALEERRAKQKADREAKKKAAADRRQKVLDARNNTNKSSDSTASKMDSKTTKKANTAVKSDTTKVKTRQQLLEEKRKKALEQREARKKALEDRKKKILEQRKKAREERLEQLRKSDSIRKAKANNNDN
ncbi:OmpH family outer membrane protein [uncultured Winogradskyella sp.]|jgi:Skp family chaperone for outer membrane proteins|uniref:OmpH family outer membrane protein n=1 Tax=uncultured Winogradskyella sp. TaxID=395353 RepID=UPI0025E2036B|nr:OmpH family outer membrane protein [uncultured Winogradskyella sp.]